MTTYSDAKALLKQANRALQTLRSMSGTQQWQIDQAEAQVREARATLEAAEADKPDTEPRPCPRCGTYCCGDCQAH